MCAVIPKNPLEIIDDPFLEKKTEQKKTKDSQQRHQISSAQQCLTQSDEVV